jgi:hypothetical protein
VNDTFKAINIVNALKELDAELEKGVSHDASQRAFKFDYDDIVVVNPSTGAEVSRKPGTL